MTRLLRSRLLRSAGVYTAGNVLNAALPILLLPVLTRALAPAEYGIVAMFHVLVGIAAPFVGLSVHGAVQRRYFDRNAEGLPTYVGNAILVLLASSALVLVAMLAAREWIARWTGFPAAWLGAVVVVAFFQFLTLLRLTLWQCEHRAVRYGLLQSMRTALNLTLAISFVVGLGLNWRGVVAAHALSAAIIGAVALVWLKRDGWVRFDVRRDMMRNALGFGVPLIPHTLAGFAITATDRVMLTALVGLSATGVYMVGAQVGLGLMLVFGSFNTAFAPWLLGRLRDQTPEVQQHLVRMTYIAMPLFLLMAAALALVAPVVLDIYVGSEFQGAATFVAWLAFGSAFNGMYLLVTNYIFFAERTALLFWATASTAVINVGLSYFLIRRFGAVGAAQATTITFLVKFLATWALSARVHPMPWFGRLKTEAQAV